MLSLVSCQVSYAIAQLAMNGYILHLALEGL